jgi:glutaredoxin
MDTPQNQDAETGSRIAAAAVQQAGKGRTALQCAFLTGNDPRALEFQEFFDLLVSGWPGLDARKEPEDGPTAPGLRVGEAVVFQAVPRGQSLDIFLAALAGDTGALPALSRETLDALAALPAPAPFTLYTAPGCPHCPAMAARCVAMALQSPLVRLTVVDGALFPEKAARDGIKAAPTLLLDGGFRWTGQTPAEEIAAVAAKRDPRLLGLESLMGFLDNGRAPSLAEMMVGTGVLIPAFLDLLAHPLFSARLGALVAMEYLAEAAPELAAQAAGPLWEKFLAAEGGIGGDILLALGETGRADFLPRLGEVAEGGYPEDIREAARDAMEKIREKAGG